MFLKVVTLDDEYDKSKSTYVKVRRYTIINTDAICSVEWKKDSGMYGIRLNNGYVYMTPSDAQTLFTAIGIKL